MRNKSEENSILLHELDCRSFVLLENNFNFKTIYFNHKMFVGITRTSRDIVLTFDTPLTSWQCTFGQANNPLFFWRGCWPAWIGIFNQ